MRLAGQPDAGVRPGQASMEHQHLLLHEVGEWQVAEGLREEVEEGHVVLRPALTAETVEDVGLEHLVVPTIQVHRARVLQFEGEEHHDHLDGPRATVNKVAVEDKGLVRSGVPGELQDVHEVPILTMEVAHDGDVLARRDAHVVQGALRLQDVNDVQHHQEGVLLRQQDPLLLHGDEARDPLRGDGAPARVARAAVGAVRLRQGLHPLPLRRQVLWPPARGPGEPLGAPRLRRQGHG
mmetsp:Transcript_72881/g.226414  ORF Transcript_72881/g.226414 Transcript_72881/m.226414 type:complete len:237 (-) Transcript_72881:21-731(-)